MRNKQPKGHHIKNRYTKEIEKPKPEHLSREWLNHHFPNTNSDTHLELLSEQRVEAI